jgi:uncharacterized iron-regulated membrane protein
MVVRRLVFWLHLLTGITAGAVILVMAVTGVLLTFEPQIVDFAERNLRTVPPPPADAARVSLGKVVAAAQDARGGEQAGTVLTLDAATIQVVRWEPFAGANLGRKLRMLVRVLHTGEVGGVIGQAIAGLASAGVVFLVCTGIALACRRARAWSVRRRLAAGRDPADASTAPTS